MSQKTVFIGKTERIIKDYPIWTPGPGEILVKSTSPSFFALSPRSRPTSTRPSLSFLGRVERPRRDLGEPDRRRSEPSFTLFPPLFLLFIDGDTDSPSSSLAQRALPRRPRSSPFVDWLEQPQASRRFEGTDPFPPCFSQTSPSVLTPRTTSSYVFPSSLPYATWLTHPTLQPFYLDPYAAVEGNDVAGYVEAVGEGVTKFKEGDKVAAFSKMRSGDQYGAYAQYTVRFFLPHPFSSSTLTVFRVAGLPLQHRLPPRPLLFLRGRRSSSPRLHHRRHRPLQASGLAHAGRTCKE